ncbi:MAG: AAA family ATPase [Muribaculaceae bacterium]|nr:AAA family ATPase [Muribaculaceae bacterium]
MHRKIYNSLREWKNNPNRKPLILLGARQVGKTYIIREFGQREYEYVAYINCHHNQAVNAIFANGFDMERILRQIEALAGVPVIAGKTLIILDEIQEVPNGIASLKYFCENAREQDVIVAGSLLGISLRNGESFPVGKVNMLYMYPMTFLEFLQAKGEKIIADNLDSENWDILSPLHDKLVDLLRQYYFCGGMPEAVKAFVDGRPLNDVRRIQLDILEAYYRDMGKHSSTMVEKIRLVWQSVPMQLARENKKFVFGAVRNGARARDLEEAIQWLVDAGIVIKVNGTTTPATPLIFYKDSASFKLYFLDIGLLGAITGVEAEELLINNSAFVEFKGALAENYVVQQKQSEFGDALFYYASNSPKMEIDLLTGTSSRLWAMEVKAGNNVRSQSLAKLSEKVSPETPLTCIRYSLLPYERQQWMTNIPLYGACVALKIPADFGRK